MPFTDISTKPYYDSDDDDILNDFYIPILKNSVNYYRLAGFFSSSSLAIAARGIQGLLNNGGKMKLIAGIVFSEKDIKAIKEGYASPERVIEEMVIKDLNQIENEFTKDHLSALSWLIARKKLEIKVAYVLSKNFSFDAINNMSNIGIFHQKVGIFKDFNGNGISFSGSVNESATAWQFNIEEFNVFREWIDGEKEHFNANLKKFEKYWFNNTNRVQVIDIPQAIEEKFIEISPKSIDTLDLDKWNKISKKFLKQKSRYNEKKKIELYEYQKKAIENWFGNGKKGIFEMATGTGKTFTALGALKNLFKQKEKLITVISCPSSHLIDQWKNEIKKFNFDVEIIVASSTNSNWRSQAANYLIDIKHDVYKKLIILVTHDTFPSSDFIEIIKGCPTEVFLIVDEMHGIGSPQRKEGLLREYKYRLGLSATPIRWYDKLGTEDLLKYFDEIVYDLSLRDAVKTINPFTGRTFLTKYEYKPIFIELSNSELKEYEKQTKKLVKNFQLSKNKKEKEDLLNIILNKRANIIKNAANKLEAFEKIIDENKPISHCLIYCSPQQIKTVQRILNDKQVIQHKFTMDEDSKPSEKYNGLSERQYLLKQFAIGKYSALVAMKCLDEGVDVPQAKKAIILSSSGNPRQYIQRRGRVLRHFPDKDKAVIYDIIVKPSKSKKYMNNLSEIEKKIFQKEIKRFEEFATVANNSLECLNKIYDVERDIN